MSAITFCMSIDTNISTNVSTNICVNFSTNVCLSVCLSKCLTVHPNVSELLSFYSLLNYLTLPQLCLLLSSETRKLATKGGHIIKYMLSKSPGILPKDHKTIEMEAENIDFPLFHKVRVQIM